MVEAALVSSRPQLTLFHVDQGPTRQRFGESALMCGPKKVRTDGPTGRLHSLQHADVVGYAYPTHVLHSGAARIGQLHGACSAGELHGGDDVL